jgi:hypothetical protein
MKTKVQTEKDFDAVKYMRQERDRISKEIKDLTPEQRLEYFRKKSEEFRKKSQR